MFLRAHQRSKDGKDHTYWSLVETVRTVGGPRQRTLCYLGELNGSAQARWLKSVEVFNEQGEAQQLKLFPSHVEVPDDDPLVARVLVNRVRLERTRQFRSEKRRGVQRAGRSPAIEIIPFACRGAGRRSAGGARLSESRPSGEDPTVQIGKASRCSTSRAKPSN